MKPQYRLITCDLDETLLNTEKKVPAANVEAIAAARKEGVKFVCTIGRGFPSIQGTLQEIGTVDQPEEYTISFNGGVITENRDNRILHMEPMDFDLAKEIFRRGIAYDVCAHVYTPDTVWVYHINPGEIGFLQGRMEFREFTDTSLDFLEGQTIIKVLFENTDYSYLKSMEDMFHDIRNLVDISYSSNRYLEFNKKGVNKGAALLRLAELLEIPQSETIAIGDNFNDLSMIRTAGLGVGVANTHPDMNELCDVILSRTNDEGAVAEAIERFVLRS